MTVVINEPGTLVLVVGPSGVGKDTLISYAREQLGSCSEFVFVRRVITRELAVGEDHEPISNEEFKRRVATDAFILHWQAHGHSYGIPAIVNDWLQEGRTVVANGSRAMLNEARLLYPTLLVINITAPIDVLATRLTGRGRETGISVRERLARNDDPAVRGGDMLHIDNSGVPTIAGEQLVKALRLSRSNSQLPIGAEIRERNVE